MKTKEFVLYRGEEVTSIENIFGNSLWRILLFLPLYHTGWIIKKKRFVAVINDDGEIRKIYEKSNWRKA